MASHRKPKTINPDEVDPSVYYYDEVYDDMQRAQEEDKRIEKKAKQKEGSKYIQGISETSERRKAEKEIRKFKRYAKDREEAQASGDLQGEDVYISKSYRKKLEEVQEAIKKQSKPDNERAFNVFKKVKYDKEDKKPLEEQSTDRVLDPTHAKKYLNCDTQESDVEHHSDTKGEARVCLLDNAAREKRPTNIEERREYLRKVLAKRTIGEVLIAAQERYRQRKFRSQLST